MTSFLLTLTQIKLLGIKQFSASIGKGCSHMHTIPPLPRISDALSIQHNNKLLIHKSSPIKALSTVQCVFLRKI